MSSIILYRGSEENFGTLGLGVLNEVTEPKVTEQLNGQFIMEFKYPKDGKLIDELKNDRLVKTSASPELRDQRFRIIRITKHSKNLVKVDAEHISNETSGMQLKPIVNFSGTAEQALTKWKNSMVDEHPFTVSSDIDVTGEGTWRTTEVENARQALGGVRGSMLDIYGGEYRFDNYRIQLYRNRGEDSQVPIMYGKNLIDLEQEEEIANTYTSIMPYAEYREDDAEEDAEPVLVTLTEHFIDSEHAEKYGRRKILKVDFSSDEIKTEEALRKRAQRYMEENKVGVPRVNAKLNFIDLAKTLNYKDLAKAEAINLGDRVLVLFSRLGINKKAKVIKVVWDPVLERYIEIEVGELRASLSDSIDKIVDDKVDGEFGDINNILNKVQVAANGKNKNFYGPDEPTTGMQKNDYWRKPVANGETELYRYTGEQWKLEVGAGINTETTKKLEAAEKAADDAREKADAAVADLEAGTSFFEHADEIGLASKDEDGNINSIIKIGKDGVAYIGGQHIILDGDTVVDGTFTVTDEIFADNMNISKFTAGTLNAKDVEIINLNADSIAGGSLRLERGIEITNDGIPIMSVNSAGEVELNISKIKINTINVEEELKKKADAEEVQRKIDEIELTPGESGKTAYEIAVENGYEGTEEEWIRSLVGEPGDDGKTAYEIAVENGFVGSEEEWLNSLEGKPGTPGKDGDPGKDGKDGKDGVSVTEISNEYYLSVAPDYLAGGSWLPDPPELKKDKFMWSKQITKLSDGTTKETDPTMITGFNGTDGKPGSQGKPGEQGRSVKEIEEQYALTDNKTTPPSQGSAEWKADIADWEDGQYVWTRSKITFTKAPLVEYTKPIVNTTWEKLNEKINTKADEDYVDEIDTKLSDTESTTEVHSDEIKSLFENIQEQYDRIQNNEVTAQEAAEEIARSIERETIIQENLGEYGKELNFLQSQIRYTDEGILLRHVDKDTGETSGVHLKLSKDSIDFMDGEDRVAFMSDSVLQINHGIFVESATIGEHKIETVDGHTFWSWVP